MTDRPDWRSRTRLLYGDEGAERLAAGKVLVAGLGAVGSFAVEALARSGVGGLTLIDFDAVEPSNANRQLFALHSTLGQPKCALARDRVLDINPDCDVALCAERLPDDPDALAAILSDLPAPDVIVDAIDDIGAKAALILHGLRRGIPVVSSMGAARRRNPALVRTGALREVAGCPLAKGLRRVLRAHFAAGDPALAVETLPADRLACVYSAEAPVPQPVAPECGPRAMGSSVCVTGAFGLAAAAAVLERLSVH